MGNVYARKLLCGKDIYGAIVQSYRVAFNIWMLCIPTTLLIMMKVCDKSQSRLSVTYKCTEFSLAGRRRGCSWKYMSLLRWERTCISNRDLSSSFPSPSTKSLFLMSNMSRCDSSLMKAYISLLSSRCLCARVVLEAPVWSSLSCNSTPNHNCCISVIYSLHV